MKMNDKSLFPTAITIHWGTLQMSAQVEIKLSPFQKQCTGNQKKKKKEVQIVKLGTKTWLKCEVIQAQASNATLSKFDSATTNDIHAFQ